ncbi:vascular cell adhesion protein 1-like [Tiliqua scincoides]|uniref:vascular cell adhesion protein 1-like n=1 Tax=Tiliqua scincoides TaxID=71010 RepID=UPI003461BF80
MTAVPPLTCAVLLSFWLPLAFLDSCDLSIYPNESVVEFGGPINLNCTSSCHTKLDWEVSDKQNIQKGTGWVSLSIANVTEWDLEPSCFVRDNDDPILKKALIYVYQFATPDIFLPSHLVAGHQGKIICNISDLMVKGSIPTNISLTLSFGRTVQKSSNGTQSMEYSFVPQPHQNRQAISCVASLQVGSEVLEKRMNSTLKVEAIPYNISISGSHAMYMVGTNITLTCHAEGNPSPAFVWNLPNNSSVTYSENMNTITISSAQTSHKGIYQCKAQNKYGGRFAQVDILVEAEKSRSWVTAVVVVSVLAVVFGGGIIWYRCRQ